MRRTALCPRVSLGGVALVAHGLQKIQVIEHVHRFEKFQIFRYRERLDHGGIVFRQIIALPDSFPKVNVSANMTTAAPARAEMDQG